MTLLWYGHRGRRNCRCHCFSCYPDQCDIRCKREGHPATHRWNPASFTSYTQEALEKYPRLLQIQLITSPCQKCAEKEYDITIPDDFLTLFLKASQHLKSCHRSNAYGLAKALGTMRSDNSDFRLPAKRLKNANWIIGIYHHFVQCR